ncbi:MAG: hypothetical protein QXU09_04460 [Thermoproteota archaeon]
MSLGTSKYEGTVVCPKCGNKGQQVIMIRYYHPRTDRFEGKREYKYRVVIHKLPNGKRKTCYLENLSPIFKHKKRRKRQK